MSTIETTRKSWFDRIRESFGKMLSGVVLVVLSVIVLFWNEGRAVRDYKTLKEGSKLVINVPSDSYAALNDGKLIHITGEASSPEILTDTTFGINSHNLRLKRNVLYYQWVENVTQDSKKNFGGSETITKTYDYHQDWVETPIDSSQFKESEKYKNTIKSNIKNQTLTVKNATLGAFTLNERVISYLNNFENLPITLNDINKDKITDDITVKNDEIYFGTNPLNPQNGDIRITYKIIPPQTISIVGEQLSGGMTAYQTKQNPLLLVSAGLHSAESMFEAAKASAATATWIIRAIGVAICIIGFGLLFSILGILADIIPFIGSIVSAGTWLVAFLLGLIVSISTICLAWIFYRPILGIILMLIIGGAIYLLVTKLKANKPNVEN